MSDRESDGCNSIDVTSRTEVRAYGALNGHSVALRACSDLIDGTTIDAFWVNPTLDGATAGEVLEATRGRLL